MNNAQVAHRWASRNFESGKGSSFFFDGWTIYSYGYHFPVAVWTDAITHSGFPVVLFNSRSYSNTTARHQSLTLNALRGLSSRVFIVPSISRDPDHRENVAHFESIFKDSILAAAKARKRGPAYIAAASNAQIDAQQYCEAFALDLPDFVGTQIDPELLASVKAQASASAKAQAAAQAKREEKRRADYMEKVAEWRMGSSVYLGSVDGMPTELRLSSDGSRVETSRGAEVSVKTAKRLFSHIASGTDFNGNVDGFQLRNVADDMTITVGCHVITGDTIRAFVAAQGWTA